jgi:hypothetical protein
MQALVRVGYPFTIDAHHLHPVVWGAISIFLHICTQGPWEGVHVALSSCPSRRAQLCTYIRWFRRPAHVPRLSLFTSLLMRAVFGFSLASGWVFMVYFLARVGGMGCLVLNGHVTCMTLV